MQSPIVRLVRGVTAAASPRFSVLVEVRLREGIADPQGATIERALPALGLSGVTDLRAGKSFRFDIAATDEASALAQATEVADRLLANPVIEESSVSVRPTATVGSDGSGADPDPGRDEGPGA
jgi:phosphoribosylformylglycinamidine synthase PurS subunit